MAVGITIRFDYPWYNDAIEENEIIGCLTDLSAEELLIAAKKAGEHINIDIEVY